MPPIPTDLPVYNDEPWLDLLEAVHVPPTMHNLFYLSWRLITEILGNLPTSVYTAQVLGWMKGMLPGIEISMNFNKLRIIIDLLLQIKHIAIAKTIGIYYQLMILIEGV